MQHIVRTLSAPLALAALLTDGFTKRLGRLAAAADAIAVGDLERRVDPGKLDEVGRVAGAFNTVVSTRDALTTTV